MRFMPADSHFSACNTTGSDIFSDADSDDDAGIVNHGGGEENNGAGLFSKVNPQLQLRSRRAGSLIDPTFS